MSRKSIYDIVISREFGYINFLLKDFNIVACTEDDELLWKTIIINKWTIKKDQEGKPDYLFSNTCRKFLHQMVIDRYFGEAVRKKAYSNGMIIEHLNNSGLDCKISNLHFLLDVKNKYKGNYFDKKTEEMLPCFALRVFHNIKNSTFQITIGFTANAIWSGDGSKPLQSIKFLYKDVDYWNVLQDAETMVEKLISQNRLDLQPGLYRFVSIREEFGEYIILSDEEMKADLKPGNLVWRDGQPLMLMGDPNRVRIISSYYDPDWDV